MVIRDAKEAAAAVKQFGSINKAARAAGIARSTLRRRLKGKPAAARVAAEATRSGRSLQDFRESHDKDFIIPKRIREALRALNGGWDYETTFAKNAGVSLTDLANYRDAFAEHVVVVRRDSKRAWAGTAAAAAKMREMVR